MSKRIAIVHDYLFQFGGAEKCVEVWLKEFPNANLYTTFYVPEKFKEAPQIQKAWKEGRLKVSILQKIFQWKFLLKFYKHLVILYPIIFSLWKIKGYDTVIISSTFCAKNIRIKDDPQILFYCYTPTRFLHRSERELDHRTINPVLRILMPMLYPPLRWMDRRAVEFLKRKQTTWIAISGFIKDEIKKAYKTDSVVVVPPVDLHRFEKVTRQKPAEEFYFNIGRISFHKKVDLIIKSCLELNRKLVIAGASAFQPEMDKLMEIIESEVSKDPSKKDLIQFVGRISDQEMDAYLSRAKAFIFPPKEDFGIVPVEAMACGCPVIAYGEGGSLEYVKPGINGIFFDEHTTQSLNQTILEFEKIKNWDEKKIRESTQRFSEENFIKNFNQLIFK